jgi:hypothetical protein
MPVIFVCSNCGRMLGRIDYSDKSKTFILRTKNDRREFISLEHAYETFFDLVQKCPYCNKKLSKKPIDVKVQ